MRLPFVITAFLALHAPLLALERAAVPYGTGAAGSNARVPRAWIAGQPYVGNGTFRFTLDRAVPGAVAVLVVANGRSQIPVGPFTLWLDPLAPYFAVVATAAVAPDGTASAGFSLNDPIWQGLTVYAQWVVIEVPSLAVSASDAVQATIAQGPMVVGEGINGIESLIPGVGTIVNQTNPGVPAGMAMNRDGTLLFSAPSFGSPMALQIYDATTQPMPRLRSTPLPGAGSGLVLHPTVPRVYVVWTASNTSYGIDWYDVDPLSPTFGARQGTVGGMSGVPGMNGVAGTSISADGRRLVLSTLGLFVGPRSLIVVDVDPASPTRDQFLRQLNPTLVNGLFLGVQAMADGESAWLAAQSSGGGRLARIHLTTGAILRQITTTQSPGVLALDPRERFLLASADSQALLSLDLTSFAVRTIPVFDSMAGLALSPDASEVAGPHAAGGLGGYDLVTGNSLWTASSQNQSMRITAR